MNRDETTGRHAGRGARPRPVRRSRAVLGAGLAAALLVALGSAAPTGAVLRDRANLNLGGTGIGNPEPFDIALVQAGVLRQADHGAVTWSPAGGLELVPGHAVSVEIPVVNNGPLPAQVGMRVESGATGAADELLDLYRWTVTDKDTGAVLAGDAGAPLASGVTADSLGQAVTAFRLAARGAAPVADGTAWSDGVAGSRRTLTVTIAYPDTAAATAYNGVACDPRIVFEAESTT